MTELTVHAVQSYVRTKKGRIGRAALRECPSASNAERFAQRMVETGKAIGAMAFSQSLDADTGELEVLRVLRTFGTVCDPEDEIPF